MRYAASPGFALLLDESCVSLLVTTYQAGKLLVVTAREGQLHLEFANFDRVMGLAVTSDRLAVGTRNAVWFHRNVPDVAQQLSPNGGFDSCFVARSALVTGEIQSHEMAWSGDELWVVNTLFSCLGTLHPDFNFVPRWRPPFISELAAEDRCHLNGMVLENGQPKYVTALSETDTRQGWRPGKATGGCILDVATGKTIVRGLAMPHSPRLHQEKLYVLNSGAGQILRIDPARLTGEVVAEVPGYARGLALHGPFAFIGLSRIRETSTFGNLPISKRKDSLRCGVCVVNVETGQTLASLEFERGVEELFDVSALPGLRRPTVRGPHATTDGHHELWILPQTVRSLSSAIPS